MKTTFKVIPVVAAIFACGCSSTTTPATADAAASSTAAITGADDAKARAGKLVSGTAQSAEQKQDGAHQVWLVVMKTSGGAQVEVYFLTTGELQELKDFKGPFDYDIGTPVPGVISWKSARDKALAAKAGTVVGWKLERESATEHQWEFYVRDANEKLFEVKLTGDKGEVIVVVEKASMT